MPDAKSTAKRTFSKRDGRWYRQWREPGNRHVFKMLENRWVWEQAYGAIPEGCEIHHRDHDPTNNDISNLQCLTADEHNAYHQRLREDHIVVDGVECRRCGRCGRYEPLDKFSKRSAGTYQGYCKPCSVECHAEWRRANLDKIREYRRTYKEKQRAKRAEPPKLT